METNRVDVNRILNTGMGNSHFNKILASLDVPQLHWSSFKRHEEEVGPVIEKLVKESCEKAAVLERELTIQTIDHLMAML
ncbi:hypothetical protein TKK_0008811 [Trichogramma kaykai]